MAAKKPSFAIRFLPSLTDLAFLMPLLLLFLRMEGGRRMLLDGDTGWHVRTGEWILQNWRVPNADFFSFTKTGEPWYAWEWLWDLVFAWLHQNFGMAAVVLVSMLVLCLTFALLFRLVRAQCSNVAIAFAATLLATAGSAMHWLARPHLFTLLLTVIFCTFLERARAGQTRLLFLLPLLMVVWTNLHGGFFVGIILIGCYAAGELVEWAVERDRQAAQAALRRSRPYVFSAMACAVATLVNPYFYRLHVHMWRFLSGTFHLQYINEYQPTDFQNNLAIWFEPLVLLGVAAALWCFYRRRFAQGIMVAGWLHLALFSVRNLPIYLVIAAPVVAAMVHEALLGLMRAPLAPWMGKALKGFDDFAAEFGAMDKLSRVHLTSALGFLAVAAVFYAPAPPVKFRADYDPKAYPAEALSVLQGAAYSKSIFTDDEWGDYLIYRLYPNTQVFVDGRFDLYGEAFTKKYLDLLNVKYGWEETLNKYGVNTILLRVDTPLAGTLKESRRWRPVYDDGMAIVFRSEASLAGTGLPEANQASAAQCGGNVRGREVTKVNHRGPATTKSKMRSESL